MKRNYICILGALPMGITGCIWKSKTMILSSVVGIIFHAHPNNQVLKYIDLFLNITLSCKGALYDNNIMLLVIISGIFYILNCYIYKPNNPYNIVYNFRHVCIVNIGGISGYYLLYKHEPCLDFYFICN